MSIPDFFDFYEWFQKSRGDIMAVQGWREGQTLYNTLAVFHPEAAKRLLGSLVDPFHREVLAPETWEFIMENWEDAQ